MTTETEIDRAEELFAQFETRTRPEHLVSEVAPDGYPGGQRQYDLDRESGLRLHRIRARNEWLHKLSLGFKPEELASGNLPEVRLVTGRPVRTPRPDTSAQLEAMAARVASQLRNRGLTHRLGARSVHVLSRLTTPGWSNSDIRAAVMEAEALVREHDSAQAATAKTAAEAITVLVTAPCGPARKYAPGTHRLSPSELQELQQWRSRFESANTGRSMSSVGYAVWPPFVVTDPRVPADV